MYILFFLFVKCGLEISCLFVCRVCRIGVFEDGGRSIGIGERLVIGKAKG